LASPLFLPILSITTKEKEKKEKKERKKEENGEIS